MVKLLKELRRIIQSSLANFLEKKLNYWDIAAGIIILKEAGGFVDFFEDDNSAPLKKNILATNSNIHEELRDLLKKKDIE